MNELCVIGTQSRVVFFDLLVGWWILRLNRKIIVVWGTATRYSARIKYHCKALFSFQVISSPHNAVLRQLVVFEAYTLATQLGLSMFARRYYTFKWSLGCTTPSWDRVIISDSQRHVFSFVVYSTLFLTGYLHGLHSLLAKFGVAWSHVCSRNLEIGLRFALLWAEDKVTHCLL